MTELLKNPFVIPVVSAIAGSLLTVVLAKIRNKTAVFGYSVRVDRVGLAGDEPVFGSVRITLQGQEVRNLYTAMLEVENATTRDYENLKLLVCSDNETILFSEKTRVVDTVYIVNYSDEFQEEMKVPEGGAPTQAQWGRYNHEREYLIPVFNRGDKVLFTYLCTRPRDDHMPLIDVSTQTRGVKLKYRARSNVVLGVPVTLTLWRGLIVSVLAVTGCGLFLSNVWMAVIIAMMVGLTVHFIGALEYKVEKLIRNLISE